MFARWVGLAVFVLVGAGSLPGEVSGSSSSMLRQEPAISLDSIASTYATPKTLARFLRRTFTFTSDEELFGEPDYWQAPEEFLARRAGDCEDYALFSQAVLRRQGREAYVFSLFGQDGYAHTVCIFVDAGRYSVMNQDRLREYRAKTMARLASQLSASWTYGAISERMGIRGRATRMIPNPRPDLQPSLSTTDPFFTFP